MARPDDTDGQDVDRLAEVLPLFTAAASPDRWTEYGHWTDGWTELATDRLRRLAATATAVAEALPLLCSLTASQEAAEVVPEPEDVAAVDALAVLAATLAGSAALQWLQIGQDVLADRYVLSAPDASGPLEALAQWLAETDRLAETALEVLRLDRPESVADVLPLSDAEDVDRG